MPDAFISHRDVVLPASKGHRTLAQQAEEARRLHIAGSRPARQRALLEQHQHEWRAFEDARSWSLEDARAAQTMDRFRCEADLHHKYTESCKSHKEEMDAYASELTRCELRKPVVLSSLFTKVRATPQQLSVVERHADEELYGLEQSRQEAAQECSLRRLERKLMDKQQQLHLRSLASYRKMCLAQRLNSLRADEQARITMSKIRHRETEMAMAHRRQQRALDLPNSDFHAFSKANVQYATRGTQLRQRTRGNHYYVPSLCRMYGSLLEQE